MTQIKKSKTNSDTDTTDSLIIIVEAFIPLFFEDNTIQVKNNYIFSKEHPKNWKPTHLLTENVSRNIDHPPEICFS